MTRFDQIELPSNRRFGLLFSLVFAIAAIYVYDGAISHKPVIWATLCLITLAVTLIKADLLLPFNKLWMRIGLILGMVISPLVMGLIFYALITPIAVGIRLGGRDALRLRKSHKESYWIKREPIGPAPASFKNQF